jgi:hypothetical protein
MKKRIEMHILEKLEPESQESQEKRVQTPKERSPIYIGDFE